MGASPFPLGGPQHHPLDLSVSMPTLEDVRGAAQAPGLPHCPCRGHCWWCSRATGPPAGLRQNCASHCVLWFLCPAKSICPFAIFPQYLRPGAGRPACVLSACGSVGEVVVSLLPRPAEGCLVGHAEPAHGYLPRGPEWHGGVGRWPCHKGKGQSRQVVTSEASFRADQRRVSWRCGACRGRLHDGCPALCFHPGPLPRHT